MSTDFVPFARPQIGPEEENAVLEVMRSGWLTTGKVALAFESEFSAYTGAKHCLAVNSATSGLHLALEGLGVGAGDIVLVPSYTFAATAEVARYLGAEVRFVDIGKESFNADPGIIESILSKDSRVKAVLPVHFGGAPCDMERILAACASANSACVEDAAHSFPIRDGRGFVGTLGDAGVFSFYATKTLATGEGGMVCTNSDALADRISRMRLHGIDRDIWNRYTAQKASWKYEIVAAGYKYNMPDILAAIGREQLKKAERFLEERIAVSKRYLEAFAGFDWLELPPGEGRNAWHLFPLRIRPELLSIDRDRYIEELTEAGIGVSVHFIPLHLMPYWSSRYGLRPDDFPNTLARYLSEISIPIWHGMSSDQVDRVIEAVGRIGLKHYKGRT